MKTLLTKSAIVTGASGGIGRVVAKRLASDGFAVAVHYAGSPAKAEAVVTEIKGAGGKAIAVQADVAKPADVQTLFKQTLEAFGTVDVVVHTAGIMPLLPISGGDVETFDKVITTNLRGTFLVLGQASLLNPFRTMVPTSLPKRAWKAWSGFLPMNCAAET
jgi:3-oxoacyl-[acyl-carrier protein] reductase